jgi:hypothetical protein
VSVELEFAAPVQERELVEELTAKHRREGLDRQENSE